jgi:predicted RecB family nuclease
VLTASEIANAPDAILHAQFENEYLSFHFDGLVKDERSVTTPKGRPTYIPALFENGKIKTRQRIVLGFLGLILSELQEAEPAIGLVFHQGTKPTTMRLGDSLTLAREILADIKKLQQDISSPMLVLNNHCPVCEFRARCFEQAVKEDNLSLLRGMDERQIARLNKKGIFTVNQLSYTFRARRRPKRAKKSPPLHHLPLRALALREKKVFVHGDPVMTLAHTRVYLDIEGTPQDHTYYLIGIHAVSNKCAARETYWADTASNQDQINIFVSLLNHLSQYPEYSLLHFGNYEIAALQYIRAHIGEPYCGQIDDVLRHCINVLSIITAHIYFPTYSNSLKDIGSFLGHHWSDPSSIGAQTLVWRSDWLSHRDPSAKAKLIRYNSEDCAALRGVAEFLEQVISSDPITPFRDQRGTEVMRTSGLSAKADGWSIFGQAKFVLDEFRAINRVSYFDYQRDRVFARADGGRRRLTAGKLRLKPRPNETVTYRASTCPSCHCREIVSISQRKYEIVDLRFTQGGVKRWITRYKTWRYRCKRCGTQFLPAAVRGHQKPPKYGRGVVSWCMYQLLIGGQNMHRIHRSLTDIFGVSISKSSVYLFKKTAATYFKLGYGRILSDLIKGDLIHIDETTINLQKDKGYVWVLASTKSVYFFYRRSREGSFLADMLRKFKGVLVSDFFTAYDSLAVPQQRCLVHLQ